MKKRLGLYRMNDRVKLRWWAEHYLHTFCDPELCEELEGDILSNYNWRKENGSLLMSQLHLIIDVLFSVRFFSKKLFHLSDLMMITNFFKLYYRQFSKQKFSNTFHLFGLTIGFLCFLCIYSYHSFEHSFDSYYESSDRVYRIEQIEALNGMTKSNTRSSYLIADFVKESFPHIEEATGVINLKFNPKNIQYPAGNAIRGLQHLGVDQAFFYVFGIEFIEGSAATVFTRPKTMVIANSMRELLFRDEEGVGKMILVNGENYEVAGVVKDVPSNTHFSFDYLLSKTDFFENDFWDKNRLATDWSYADFIFNYVRIAENHQPELVAEDLVKLSEQHLKEDEPAKNYYLRGVEEIHLRSHGEWELGNNSNPQFVQLIMLLGVIILLFTTINFTFISIAKMSAQSGVFGIRKILGSSQLGIATQMILENVLTVLVAFGTAFGLVFLLESLLPQFFLIKIYYNELLSVNFIGLAVIILLFTGIASAWYPLRLQLKMQPLDSLRGKILGSEKKIGLLHSLVLLQVFFSVSLIASTHYFRDQINFMLNKDPGFELKEVAYMERYIRGRNAPSYRSFKEHLLTIPGIKSVTNSAQLPLKWPAGHSYELIPAGAEVGILTSRAWIGYDYFKTLEIEMTEGREFSETFASDTSAIIISTSAAKALGLQTPLGEKLEIFFRGGDVVEEKTVIGVVDDFNYRTLHSDLLPHYYILAPNGPLITINSEDIFSDHMREAVKEAWKDFSPDEAFNIMPLQDHFLAQYEADISLKNAIEALSIIMIILASMGIFGVSAYVSQRRIKEIAIRKVFGAGTSELITLQMKIYLLLIALGFGLSIIPVYLFIDNWLNGYAYRIGFSPWNFFLALISITLIILLVTGFNTFKVALVNPVKTLKDE